MEEGKGSQFFQILERGEPAPVGKGRSQGRWLERARVPQLPCAPLALEAPAAQRGSWPLAGGAATLARESNSKRTWPRARLPDWGVAAMSNIILLVATSLPLPFRASLKRDIARPKEAGKPGAPRHAPRVLPGEDRQ